MEPLRPEDVDRRMDALLLEATDYFMGVGNVHDAAADIARILKEMGIDYAIAGALALGVHGFRRFTEDVDVLISKPDLERFKKEWVGRGYVDVRPGGRAVRDTRHATKIDFLIVGDFPGDGAPKPVAFPPPRGVAVEGDRYRVLALPALVELKLASGMTAPHRAHDLADVQKLIRVAAIPRDFAQSLQPYVRDKFDELWQLAQRDDDY